MIQKHCRTADFARAMAAWSAVMALFLAAACGKSPESPGGKPGPGPSGSSTPAQAAGATSGAQETPEQREFMARLRAPRSAPIPLATYSGGKVFTTEDLEDYLRYFRPAELQDAPMEAIYGLPFAKFGDLLATAVASRLLAEEGKEAGLLPLIEKDIAAFREQTLIENLVRASAVAPKPPTLEDTFRQMNLNMADYTIPMSSHIVQLFFPTLKEYTVVAGDSLESVAKQVSGDAAMAGLIRDARSNRMLAIPPAARAYMPPLPMEAGQKLLVPAPPDERAKAKERAQAAFKRIQKGESLEAVGPDFGFSQADMMAIGPLPMGRRPLAPEIYAAISSPDFRDGQTTGVLETSAGYHIVYMVNRQDAAVRSIDEAHKEQVEKQMSKAAEAAVEQFLQHLTVQNLTFHEDVLMDDKAATSAVVCEAFSHSFTVADIEKALKHPKFLPRDVDERKKEIRGIPVIRRAVGAGEAEKEGLDKTEDFKKQMRAVETENLAKARLGQEAQPLFSESESNLQAYYKANEKDYASQAEYDVWEIALQSSEGSSKGAEEAQRRLSQIKPSLTSLEAFKKQAQGLDYRAGIRWNQGHISEVPAGYRGDEFAEILQKVPLNKAAGPYTARDETLLIWVSAITPSQAKPFEEVREKVLKDYRERRMAEVQTRIIAETLRKAGFAFATAGK